MCRILVADDLHANADCLVELLNLSGHVAFPAYNGWEAVTTAQWCKPAVAILDLQMPLLDGFGVALELMKLASPPLLIALTALSSPAARAQTAEYGFAHHLLKPAALSLLLNLIDIHTATLDAGL